MSWWLLIGAGLLEVLWAFAMKQSHGFTHPIPSSVTLIALIASFGLLSLALKSLPLSVAYPTWTGIGAVGSCLVGYLFLGDAMSPLKMIGMLLLIGGMVLIKLA